MNKPISRVRLRPALGTFVLAVAAAISPASASDLAPYRAAYTLKLEGPTSGSAIVDARGAMTAEWRETCEGWAVEQRIRLELINGDGDSLVTDTGYTSWEAKDGLSFRFNVRTLRNEEVAEEFRGDALLGGRGKGGEARFTVPESRTMKLPPGTVFPMVHSEELLRAALEGKQRLVLVVFDGATKEGMAEISAVIGKRGVVPHSEKAEPLTTRPYWPVRMAFFDVKSTTPEPHYELGLRMFDNGVAGDQQMDFGDFRVRATLTEIEALPKPKC